MRFLFVCSGNTCRSPMAEALSSKEAERRGLTGHEFQSAGLNAVPGARVEMYTVEVLSARGIDIDRRLAQQLTAQMVQEADTVLVMTRSQANMLMDELPQFGAKIHTLGGYSGTGGDVQDPYMGSAEDYESVAVQLEEMVGILLDRLR